jgi:molecular chaperone GrpE
MTADRKQRVPTVAPGEPEAPVAGNQPPAPAEPAAPPAEPAERPTPTESAATRGQGRPGPFHGTADSGASAGRGASAEDAGPGAPAKDGGRASAAEPELDHERQLERDLEELADKAQKADAYLELAQRTKADFENYRRRAAREAATAQERGVAKLALELLPAVDNLDRAVMAAEAGSNGGADTLVSGIKLVHADVIAALGRVGIESYSPVGEQFDPQCHEAVAQQPVPGAEPGTVVEVYQRGYRLGDVVIRPARVVVAG